LQNSSEGWILLIFQSKCGTPHLVWVEHPGESRSLVCNFPMFDKIPYQQMPPDVEHLQADRRRTRPKPVPLIEWNAAHLQQQNGPPQQPPISPLSSGQSRRSMASITS
jgi:hypothetical protein